MCIANDVCGCYAICDTCTQAGFSCWVMDFPFESLWQEHFCSELDLNLGVLVPPYRSIYVTCGQQARLCFIEFQGDGWSYAILSEVSISVPLSAVFVDVQLLRQCVCLFVFLCAYCFCLLCTRAPCGLFRMIDWLIDCPNVLRNSEIAQTYCAVSRLARNFAISKNAKIRDC